MIDIRVGQPPGGPWNEDDLKAKTPTKRRARNGDAEDGTLTDRAYRELEEMIVTLQLSPGTILSEQALAQRLKIGRTPIREALQRLARDGLVVIMPRRGRMLTSRSRASRCSASRIGVRPMPSRCDSMPSDTTDPGASCSVTISSSRSV